MFPFLIILTAFLLIATLVAIGTVGFNPGAIRPMLRAPRHALRLIISKRWRQNHALEHATENVLWQRYRQPYVTGMPDESGFHLRGRLTPDTVVMAAQDALRRLQRGEAKLAISRSCPTSLVAAQLGMLLIPTAILLILREFTAPFFLIIVIAAALLGPVVSPWLQRFLFTTANVADIRIMDVDVEAPSGRVGFIAMVLSIPIFVQTASTGRRGGKPGDGDVTLITREKEEIPVGSYRVRKD